MTPAILLLLFGVVTAALSVHVRVGTLRAPGSGFFPFYVGLLLALLAVIHLAQSRRRRRDVPAEMADAAQQGSWQRALLFLGTTAVATGLFTVIGYPLAAFALMALLLYILGVRRWTRCLFLALCAAGVSYALFVRWLQIPLPMAGFGF